MFSSRIKTQRFTILTLAAMCFMGCSDGRPSDAKVELDLQEVFHRKVGNDLVTPRVLEIENVTSPAEDRLIYTLKFRFESDGEKSKRSLPSRNVI